MLHTHAFYLLLTRELLWIVRVSNLVKFWTGITAMVHGKIITHPPFHKAKKKSTNYLFFFVKTYGSNYFQLKTKAWNNYQMILWHRLNWKKKVCKLSTSIPNQPLLYLISIQIPVPPPCSRQTFRWNQSAIFHLLNSLQNL